MMGDWELTAIGAAMIVSSGVVAVEGKDNSAVADFSLKYSWLKDQIERNPGAGEYEMSKYSVVTLRKALRDNKLDKLGELEVITKLVDVNHEIKREYKEKPKNGKRLLHCQFRSVPIDISQVKELSL